jgi:hypothetical protein
VALRTILNDRFGGWNLSGVLALRDEVCRKRKLPFDKANTLSFAQAVEVLASPEDLDAYRPLSEFLDDDDFPHFRAPPLPGTKPFDQDPPRGGQVSRPGSRGGLDAVPQGQEGGDRKSRGEHRRRGDQGSRRARTEAEGKKLVHIDFVPRDFSQAFSTPA